MHVDGCGRQAGARLRARTGARGPNNHRPRPRQHVRSGGGPYRAIAAKRAARRHRLLERRLGRTHGRRACRSRRRRRSGASPIGAKPRRCTKAPSALPCSASSMALKRPISRFVTEQDILGDRMVRARGRARRSQNFLSEASALATGDLVTHIEHGVGRYLGLKAIEVQSAPHDCLELQYDGGKLFLPVENIELLTRFGSEEAGVQLDKLGGVGWQHRKGAHEGARARDGGGTDPHRRGARPEGDAAHRDSGRALRRILRPVSLCRDRGSGTRHRRCHRRSRQGPPDGPAGLRRCRLRKNRGCACAPPSSWR